MPETTRQVGRYEILREIGRGGMGVVYLARQPDLERAVALKELHAAQASHPSLVRRFVRESRLGGALAHPNIVTVHDYFEWEGMPYIAMEYVAAGSLRPHIGHLSLSQIAGVLEGVLAGLAHAEQHRIVHRDLKPENIMVSGDGRVKIADFGIAKATAGLGASSFHTATGTTLGTPSYMAPEQAMAQDVGPWTDLYSVGCMAYEMATGKVPFADTDSPVAILLRQVNESPPPACEVAPSVDTRVSDWIGELLQKDPQARPHAADRAWQRFEEIVIASEGPYWRRASRLRTAGGGEPARIPGPYTPPPEGPAPRGGPFASIDQPAVDTPVPCTGRHPASTRTGRAPDTGEYESYVPPPPMRPPRNEVVAEALRSQSPNTPAPSPKSVRPAAPVPPTTREQVATVEPAATEPGDGERARGERRRRARGATVLAGLILLAVTVLAVALTGGEPGEPGPPGREAPVEAGALRAQPPPGWTALSRPIRIPGLELAHAASIAGPRGTAALLGFAPASAHRASLLSTDLTDALGLRSDVVPDSARTQLRAAGLEALRYQGLRPPGLGRAVTLYATPTSAGVATLACVAPPDGAERLERDCRRIADSLSVPGAKAFSLGPSAALARGLNQALRQLDQVLNTQRSRLRGAPTAQGQAGPATAIAKAYRDAGRQVEAVKLSPADEASHHRFVRTLRSAEAAYRRLAAAAKAADRPRYRTAATRAEVAERSVKAALGQLADDGYRGLISERYEARAIPAMKPGRRPPHESPPRGGGVPTPGPRPTPTPPPHVTPTPTPDITPTPTPEIQICPPRCGPGGSEG